MSLKAVAALCGAFGVFCGCAQAQGSASSPAPRSGERVAARPIVIEMFLSQACSQSPPAAELLNDLAARKDVVALTWHVDYWDELPALDVGAWKDPFANPAFAERQLAYNQRLRGRAMKITPQAIIDGVISVAGAKRESIEAKILEAQFYDEMSRPIPPVIDLEGVGGQNFRVRIKNVGAPYDALVVTFRPEAATKVAAGDNAGVVFREANVVRSAFRLTTEKSGPSEFYFAAPSAGLDCAVIVQERNIGRIVAARYCSSAAGQ